MYMRTASWTTSSANLARGRAVLRLGVKLVSQDLQKNLGKGLGDPARPLGAVSVLPLRLVSRLPQRGQRTRRFSHPEASYPVVTGYVPRMVGPTWDFVTSSGPLNWTLSLFPTEQMFGEGLACSRVPHMFRKPTRNHACSVPSRTQ
jgi:hypothetical protein